MSPIPTERRAGVLILSYRRAGKIRTLKALQQIKWTGPVYIVVSSDDEQLPQYRELYPNLYVFDRQAVQCDYYDNLPPTGPLAARNKAWDIAQDLGWTHFVVLDDDYTRFYVYSLWPGNPNHHGVIRWVPEGWGDRLFHRMWDFLDNTPKVLCITFSQTGDMNPQTRRKIMQTFFLRTDRRFEFVARLNDDVTTYYDLGLRGEVVIQIPAIMISQGCTQSQPGGLTEEYLRYGTYAKSMYTVLRWPAHCKVEYLPQVGRVHHHIVRYPYPCIIREPNAPDIDALDLSMNCMSMGVEEKE